MRALAQPSRAIAAVDVNDFRDAQRFVRRDLLGAVLHHVADQTQVRARRKQPFLLSDVLLEDVSLQGAVERGDVDTLAAYASRAPGMPYAHPTVDHYIPLFVTLGAATQPDAPVDTTIEGFFIGLSKRSFQVA